MYTQSFFIFLTVVAFAGSLFLFSPVYADGFGLSAAAEKAEIKNSSTIPTLIGNVVGIALSLVSVLFFLLMLYGGVLWMTARGKEDQSKKALDIIIAAVIGVLLVLGAYVLTQFVFSSLS